MWQKLPANSVVMYLPVLEDATEKAYVAVDALSKISEPSNVPIYSFYDVVVGHGTVGGYVRSFGLQGKTAAELGLRIMYLHLASASAAIRLRIGTHGSGCHHQHADLGPGPRNQPAARGNA